MPIVFSAVTCDRNIVAKFASCDGNFTEIAEQVLSKLPQCNNKMTYSHGIYLLHYIAEDEYLYFCITDKLCQRSRAFLFLNEIQRRFVASKQTDDDFTTVLAAEMYRYSEDYSTIVIRKGELDELNSIGVGCSESILGEKILYINNPDIISYSTISHVSATPEHISVSGVSPTPEEISVVPIFERISVMSPTVDRTSAVTPSPERMLAENAETISIVTPTVEENVVVSPSIDIISAVDSTPERISIAKPNTETESRKSLRPEIISAVRPTSEEMSDETPETTTNLPTSDRISDLSLNQEQISSMSPITDSIPVMSPRLYVIIIGMIMLVIAMSVYALGPISCVVVTTVAVYSLLRSYAGSKDKSE